MKGPPRPIPKCKERPKSYTEELKYVTRLDTDKPGLYVIKVSGVISIKRRQRIYDFILPKIIRFSPGSDLLVLDGPMDVVEIHNKTEPEPSDAWINERIGKKETIEFPKWQSMKDAPTNRYILIRHEGECAVVRWNDDTGDWVDAENNWYSASEWMELPK